MSKVIVTGSKGFIGRKLIEKLSHVYEVLEYDMHNCWELLDGVFEDSHSWDDIECIFHMGAISDTTVTDPIKVNHYNVKYTISLFQKAIAKRIPVKYASSASVYGDYSPFNKKYNPLNFYALSKLTVDYWVEDHLEEFSAVQGFRFFNVYGDGEEDKIERNQSSPVSKFIVQANTENKITVFEGSNKMLRDFICVDDVVDLVISNTKGSGIFDLGTGSVCSFQEVAELVSKKFGVPIQTVPFPKHLIGKYQYFTESSEEWQHKFITVSDYVKNYLH
tara:strand:- start:7213 stop:8040 length:828 start_codon:yes stop_codon:yes gene_type:complete